MLTQQFQRAFMFVKFSFLLLMPRNKTVNVAFFSYNLIFSGHTICHSGIINELAYELSVSELDYFYRILVQKTARAELSRIYKPINKHFFYKIKESIQLYSDFMKIKVRLLEDSKFCVFCFQCLSLFRICSLLCTEQHVFKESI